MTIHEIRPDAARHSGASPVQGTEKQAEPVSRTAAATRADRVEISAEGRALAAKEQGRPLSAERIAEIRQRIADGAYNDADMAEAVALRLLESGDLESAP